MYALLVALLSGSPEMATESGDVQWTGPASCPDAAQMQARIDAAGGTGRLRVTGEVTHEADEGWRLALSLELDGQTDTRTLTGDSCEELADAAELLIAVRRDELATQEPPPLPEPEPAPPEDEPAPPTPIGVPEPTPGVDDRGPAPPPDPPRPRPLRGFPRWPTGLQLGAAAGVGLGATPNPGIPVEVAIGGAWPRLRIALRGRYHVPRQVQLADGRTATVQVGIASLEACARPGVARVELPLCGQVGVGGSRADGGGGQIRDRRGVWAETGLDLGVAWHLRPWWALTARLGGAAVLTGAEYVRGDELVFRPARVHGRVVVGVEFRIPIQIQARPGNG